MADLLEESSQCLPRPVCPNQERPPGPLHQSHGELPYRSSGPALLVILACYEQASSWVDRDVGVNLTMPP